MLDADSEHRQSSEEACSSLTRYYHLSDAVVATSEGVSTIVSSQLLQRAGNTAKSVNSTSIGPLLHLLCCEVGSLNRNNAVWNNMAVDKIVCKPTDDNFGTSIVQKEIEFIFKLCLFQ